MYYQTKRNKKRKDLKKTIVPLVFTTKLGKEVTQKIAQQIIELRDNTLVLNFAPRGTARIAPVLEHVDFKTFPESIIKENESLS